MTKGYLIGAVLFLAGPLLLTGQTPTGTIQGVLQDTTGAVVPSVAITITNVNTGEIKQLQTDQMGRYVQPFLMPGTYSVSLEAKGFRPMRRDNVKLDVGQNLSVDFTLELSTVSQEIVVQAAPPPIETNTSSMGQVIENKRIIDLPLNGRSPFALANLAPGVNPAGRGSTPIIGGGRNATSELQIDGVTDIGPENNVGNTERIYEPQVDSVEEFNVIVNALSAEYGRFGGGVINVVTKSGTNKFHGTTYSFVRHTALDANNFFSNRAGQPKGQFKRYQWGGTAGGPIVIPGLYDGHDKSFFFQGFEGTNSRTRSLFNGTVPTPEWRAGDFSNLRNYIGQPITIFDPLTVRQDPDKPTQYIRSAFPGNRIPANRFDPVAVKTMNYFVAPNATPVNPYTQSNNFFHQGTNETDSYRSDTRIDHNWSEHWRMFARVSVAWNSSLSPNRFQNPGTPSGGTGGGGARQVSLDHTFTLTPTLMINARYGFGRNRWWTLPASAGFRVTELGFPKEVELAAARNHFEFPQISISSFSRLGQGGWATADSRSMIHSANVSVTKVFTRHTMKTGMEYRKFLLNYKQFGYPSGSYNFGAGWTQREISTNSAREGFGLASFLLGLGSGSMSHDPIPASASSYYGFYIQDDWKVNRKLTLNIGLRYDLDLPRTDRFNQLSYFRMDVPSPLAGKVPASACPNCGDLRGAMFFTSNKNRRQTPVDKNNFGPRFGLAYQLARGTVIRAAYGIAFAPSVLQAAGSTGSSGMEGFRTTTSMIDTTDNMRTIETYLRNPFPNGFNFPLGSGEGALTNIGLSIGESLFDGWKNAYIQQWNFNIQRSLPANTVVEIGYMANRGIGLADGDGGQHYNQLPTSYLQYGSQLTASVNNPFYGLITNPSSALSRSKVQFRQLERPFPHYGSVESYRKAIANSIYHAMTLRVDKRFSSGLGVLFSYTAGKLMDDASATVRFLGQMANTRLDAYNRRLEWSVSSLDVSQRAVISAVYELPLGRGKRFLNDLPRATNLLVSGWQVNGIIVLHTGQPLIINARTNNTFIYTRSQRPNNNGTSAKLTGGTQDERMMRWFNTDVFSQPPSFTLGNTSRTLPDTRSPGTRNTDLSLFKNNYFGADRRFNLQIRAEAFNAFNTTQFGFPGTTVEQGSFGVISSTAVGARQIQMAAKFIW